VFVVLGRSKRRIRFRQLIHT